MHERSVDSDFLLLELRDILKRNKTLKVILVSGRYELACPLATLTSSLADVGYHQPGSVLRLLRRCTLYRDPWVRSCSVCNSALPLADPLSPPQLHSPRARPLPRGDPAPASSDVLPIEQAGEEGHSSSTRSHATVFRSARHQQRADAHGARVAHAVGEDRLQPRRRYCELLVLDSTRRRADSRRRRSPTYSPALATSAATFSSS